MRAATALALLAALLCAAAPAQAGDLVLHADLPLSLSLKHGQAYWPKYLFFDNGEMFIGSKFATGDWKSVPADCDEVKTPDCATWMRLEIVSAFHRFFEIGQAERRDDLADSGGAVIIELAPDLYALEIGFVPGSSYILFSASRRGDALIKEMNVLDPHCLKIRGATFRQTRHIDHFLTGYCAVNTAAALTAIARDALKRPPAARMTWIGAAPAKP